MALHSLTVDYIPITAYTPPPPAPRQHVFVALGMSDSELCAVTSPAVFTQQQRKVHWLAAANIKP